MKIAYLQDIIKWFRYRKYHVVLDGRANSVTISKAIYDRIMSTERNKTDIFVFKVSDTQRFCFGMREDFEALVYDNLAVSQLQYNEKYRTIGFRTDKPSVTYILTEYGLPVDKMVRLNVRPRKTCNGETYYEIQKLHN